MVDPCKNNLELPHNKDKWRWITKIIENNSTLRLNMKTLGLHRRDNILVTENKIWFSTIHNLNMDSSIHNKFQIIINNHKNNKLQHLVILINHLVIINHLVRKEQDRGLLNNLSRDNNKLLHNKNNLLLPQEIIWIIKKWKQ